MAAKLNLVKKIVNDETINSYQLILNALFGKELPLLYDPNQVYEKGDAILANDDGKYQILICTKNNVTGPFNPELWEDIAFTEIFKNTTLLQDPTIINNKQEALVDDLGTLVFHLAGILDNYLDLNSLYRENFKNDDRLKIITGTLEPGSLNSVAGKGIEFQLKAPYELKIQPSSFKFKHLIEVTGLPNDLTCQITFNALDANPTWLDASEALYSSAFFDLPEDMEKEEEIPYALDIKVKGVCNSTSAIKISDFMVMFV